jgi:hypothetical protein
MSNVVRCKIKIKTKGSEAYLKSYTSLLVACDSDSCLQLTARLSHLRHLRLSSYAYERKISTTSALNPDPR